MSEIFDKSAKSVVPEELEELYERREEATKHQDDWRDEAREAYEFRDGEQWTSDDQARLEEQNRPCVTFNRIAPVLDSVVGYEINNRRETRYRPRTVDDGPANELFTRAAMWVRDRCDAEDEEVDAYSDAIATGMGFIETRVDYEEEPDGKIVMERVSPLLMKWDPKARKANLADSDFFIKEEWVDVDELREDYPEHADAIEATKDPEGSAEWLDDHDATNAWRYRDTQSWYDEKTNKALLMTYQWREKEVFYQVGDNESQRVLSLPEKRFEKLKDAIDSRGIPYVRRRRWVYKQQIAVGHTLLEEGPAPIEDGFSFRAITGKRDEQSGLWYGMVRAMKDPQRWSNTFFSQAMYILQANSKGGVMIEEGAVQDVRAFEDAWADPAGVVTVEDGALTAGRIKEKPPGVYPPQLDRLMNTAIQAIRDVSGVNMELLGMVGHEQTGILEIERKKSALTILAPFINSLKRYRKMQGRDLLSFMRRYIKPGTIMRVTGQPEAMVFWVDKGDETIAYDVIVDDAPDSPNLKSEVWATMQNIMPAMVKAGVPIPPQMIKFSPLPSSVADAWIEYVDQQQQMPDIGPLQEQLEQMQAELQKLQQENLSLKDKREAQAMQIQFKEQEALLNKQIREQEMALDARQKEMELLFKAKMSQADRETKMAEITTRYETEMAKIQANAQLQAHVDTQREETERTRQVVSLTQERERRQAEAEARQREAINPHIEQIQDTAAKLDELAADFAAQREAAEANKAVIVGFLKSRGGDIAQVAERIN